MTSRRSLASAASCGALLGAVTTAAILLHPVAWGAQSEPLPLSDVTAQIISLTRRVAALESSRNRVVAPFTVVDAHNTPILQVRDGSSDSGFTDHRGIVVFSSSGAGVSRLSARGSIGELSVLQDANSQSGALVTGRGGYLGLLVTTQGNQRVFAGVFNEKSDVQVSDSGGQLKADLVADSGGQLALEGAGDAKAARKAGDVPNEAPVVQGMVLRGGGTGGLTIYDKGKPEISILHASGMTLTDAKGTPRVMISMASDKSFMGIFNKATQPIAFMTENDHYPGGSITVADSSGTGVFSAGAVGDHAAEVCVDRRENSLKCLGTDLPLTFH